MSDAADLLDGAAQLVARPGGWCRHATGDPKTLDGPHDLYGALEAILLARGYAPEVYWQAREAVADVTGVSLESERTATLSDWNDAEGRTPAQLGAALRAAASRIRAQEERATNTHHGGTFHGNS